MTNCPWCPRRCIRNRRQCLACDPLLAAQVEQYFHEVNKFYDRQKEEVASLNSKAQLIGVSVSSALCGLLVGFGFSNVAENDRLIMLLFLVPILAGAVYFMSFIGIALADAFCDVGGKARRVKYFDLQQAFHAKLPPEVKAAIRDIERSWNV